jgi:hypothetical protein
MKVLISVIPYGQETHGELTFKLWQIRHLDLHNRPPDSKQGCACWTRTPGNTLEGLYAKAAADRRLVNKKRPDAIRTLARKTHAGV